MNVKRIRYLSGGLVREQAWTLVHCLGDLTLDMGRTASWHHVELLREVRQGRDQDQGACARLCRHDGSASASRRELPPANTRALAPVAQNAPPKTKYIEHILVATHSGEAGIGEVFRALQNRLRDSTWTVVFKSLITVHLMIREGSPDVTLAFLSTHRNLLAISNFTDGTLRLAQINPSSSPHESSRDGKAAGHCN
ncbi:enth domain-containing protein [Ilyonectria robusta]